MIIIKSFVQKLQRKFFTKRNYHFCKVFNVLQKYVGCNLLKIKLLKDCFKNEILRTIEQNSKQKINDFH